MPETFFDQRRQITAVVYVRMAQDTGAYILRVKGEVRIYIIKFIPSSLEKSAIKQNVRAVRGQQVHRTGHGTRAAAKFKRDCQYISLVDRTLDQFLDPVYQFVQVVRLWNIIVRSGQDPFVDISDLAFHRKHDHRNMLSCTVFF